MDRKRTVQITLRDGSKWEVPLEHIADNRDHHYGCQGSGEDDDYMDWAVNNMDWGELRDIAVKARDENMSIDKAIILVA